MDCNLRHKLTNIICEQINKWEVGISVSEETANQRRERVVLHSRDSRPRDWKNR